MFKQTFVLEDEDVRALTGISSLEYEFAQMAENGSYQRLDLDDGSMEDLHENIGYETNARRRLRLEHQLRLANILRKQGYRDFVLIHIFW